MSKWIAVLSLLVSVAGFGQSRECGTLASCRSLLETNPDSSIAHYRIAELFLRVTNYQTAANELRAALNGDLDPKWTEVWSHVELGKIFDATDQRDRAVKEYRLAMQTGDNTRGAIDEARKYLQSPNKRGE